MKSVAVGLYVFDAKIDCDSNFLSSPLGLHIIVPGAAFYFPYRLVLALLPARTVGICAANIHNSLVLKPADPPIDASDGLTTLHGAPSAESGFVTRQNLFFDLFLSNRGAEEISDSIGLGPYSAPFCVSTRNGCAG